MTLNTQKKRLIGMALGATTSLPVTALSFLGNRVFRLPFIAFNLLDTITRLLPRLMTLVGIDRLMQGQETTTPNLGALSGLAQPLLAVFLLALFGVFFGLILAGLERADSRASRLVLFGLAGGGLLWGLFLLLNVYLGFPAAGPLWSIVFLGALLLSWGALLGWMVHQALTPESDAGGMAQGRRRFLYLAGSAAAALLTGGMGWLFSQERGRSPEAEKSFSGEVPVFKSEASAVPPSLENLGVADTSGPAASPHLETLQTRAEPAPQVRSEITSTADFYNIDINTDPPVLDPGTWRVDIRGLVDSPMSLSLEDLWTYPEVSQFVTLSCISNDVGGSLISTAKWTGIRLVDLLADAGLQSGVQELHIEGADGFFESVSMADMMDPRTLLVYRMNGKPLPYEHGYPLRIYIPNRFGMKQPKWIVRMEAIDEQGPGYWVERGWSAEAIAKTTSVIDHVAVGAAEGETVTIGGIAWAGARGIRQVEVQVDEGDWAEATLRTPALSPLTWVQWRYDWPLEPGEHTARVRATDGEGALQAAEETGRRPDGATGIYSIHFEV